MMDFRIEKRKLSKDLKEDYAQIKTIEFPNFSQQFMEHKSGNIAHDISVFSVENIETSEHNLKSDPRIKITTIRFVSGRQRFTISLFHDVPLQ